MDGKLVRRDIDGPVRDNARLLARDAVGKALRRGPVAPDGMPAAMQRAGPIETSCFLLQGGPRALGWQRPNRRIARRQPMRRLLLVTAAAGGISFAANAFAHAGQRGFILLLPTGLYLLGGALAVALSFAIIALVPSRRFSRLADASAALCGTWRGDGMWPSAAVLGVFLLLLLAGWTGSRDPLGNPLPLSIWTLWWVGFTFLTALAGNLWSLVNPWRAAYRAVSALPGMARWRATPPLAYPAGLGHWPAVVLLFAFCWFELIYPAPQDPAHLAAAALGYAALTLAGMLAFGEERWLRHAEAFTVFFRLVARLSPLAVSDKRLSVGLPCRGLLEPRPLPVSGTAFVLLALACVTFDGLSRTFWWLGLIGENPLEHPGRTALVGVNTLGLLATAGALGLAYLATLRLGRALAGGDAAPHYGLYVAAIVPIAFGYHFAHYLPNFLVDVQYAMRALSDPFQRGWDLLGAAGRDITTSFLSHHGSVRAIWNVQVAAIVAAHVAAVFVAHVLALRAHARVRAAVVSQVPMTLLMIGYTVFGLWLLSTPVAA